MGYNLYSPKGARFRFTSIGWSLALNVARHYGWQSAGIPKPGTWDEKKHGPWGNGNDYWMNAGQMLTANDAAALTAALDRAVAASDFAQTAIRIENEIYERLGQRNPHHRDLSKSATREQTEDFRKYLAEFADLTRDGPFIIT